MKRYFGGSTVKGTVRQMSANSFKALVENYFNVPVMKKFTRQEFDSYDKDTRDTAKDGPFITAAVFNGNDVKRTDANCIGVSLALLDFDSLSPKDAAEGFIDYASQLHAAPEVIRDQLHPYNFVCYETISSRKGQRRVRILVDLQEMGIDYHKAAVRHVASMLGVDVNRWKGRIESMTLSLPMFRPVGFQGEDYAAVLCSRTDGLELEDLDIPKELVTGSGGVDASGRSYAYDADGESLDLMHLPVQGISIDDVADMLKTLDADDNYHMWVKVGMALRHQFRNDEDESRKAFELFDEWSSRGTKSKYVDADETYGKWKSFKPDATGKAPTTLRTVFEEAKKHGWDPTVLSKKIKRDLSDWIKRCLDPDELMQRGAAKIAAMPFKNEIVEEALFKAIKDRIAELADGLSINIATIKKSVRTLRQRKAMDGEDDDSPPWLRPWVFITTRNLFRHVGNGIELSPEAFNNTYSRELMNLSPDSESALTGRPTIMPVHFALNVKSTKRVDGTTYDPRYGDEEPFFTLEGREYLNEFRTSTIPKLDPENAKKAGKIFKHAVETVLGKSYSHTFIDFIAHTVQHPGKIIRWAFLIQSAQGAGKNMILNAVGHALGFNANFKTINAKAVMSDFNEWVSGAQLIVLDEIKIPGHSKADLTNSLKDMITNDTVSVAEKFKSLCVVQNVANKIALTNWQDALHIEDTDRRWMVIKSPLQTKAECAQLAAQGHFVRLAKLYKHGGALRQWLLDWEISEDFPVNGPAPDTAFRHEMVGESKNRLQEEIEDLIEDPEQPMIGKDLIFTPSLTSRITQGANNHKPSHYLRRMGYDLYREGMKVYVGGVRGTIWIHRDHYYEDVGCPLAILADRLKLTEESDF